MTKLKTFLLILIITTPAFISLLNNSYFPMHDDQHIARLFLLDQGIRQGDFFPRWVDSLGFNFGYPLYNFYPPLIYYTAEIFHMFGLSLIWSIKLTFITGFILGGFGIYLLAKSYLDKLSAFFSTVIYTYFTYHAVLIYVRGALAEFFAYSILPYVLLSFHNIYKNITFRNSIFFGISLALLILTHPLIAVPSIIFIGSFFVYFLLITKDKAKFFLHTAIGGIISLLLSAFFWLPSMAERRFTLVDSVLIRELASYTVHYIYPGQLLYSPWGFGGSIEGPVDGMSFQLGRIIIGFIFLSVLLSIIAFLKKRKHAEVKSYSLLIILLGLSLFMTTEHSFFIWDNLQYLWYLQFPWRFLTFAGIFTALVCGYIIYFTQKIFVKNTLGIMIITAILSLGTIGVYQKYFKPSTYINTSDKELTSFEEIAWRVSRTSFEFIPRGVKTTKSDLNTTIPAITKNQVSPDLYEIIRGQASVKEIENKFAKKTFTTSAVEPIRLRLNTYNFPGWRAYIDGQEAEITDLDDYKRIIVRVPSGNHRLEFRFTNTPVRTIGNTVSLLTTTLVAAFLFYPKKKKFTL